MESCKVCGGNTTAFSKAKVLNKYRIQYFRCSNCNSVQVESPYWLQEAYAEAITSTDIGLVNRNLNFYKQVAIIIDTFSKKNGNFLDYGGGYGMFVRLMRDKGYNFNLYDPFCKNLLAAGFDIQNLNGKFFDLVTAFEVFEHLNDPNELLENLFQKTQNLIFSTQIISPKTPLPEEWWFYGLDHGQHTILYSREGLEILAKKYNKFFYTNGRGLHMFSEKKINSKIFSFITKIKVANLYDLFKKEKSFLRSDFEVLKKKVSCSA